MKTTGKSSIDFFLSLRCTNREHAKSFVEKGELKFSTPHSWVAYEEKNGKGRGDVLEGTFACCNLLDFENAIRLSRKYKIPEDSDIETYISNGKIFFKRKRVMELPAFCIYLLKEDMFECPQTVGRHSISTTIPAKYFRDFCDHKTPEEIQKLPIGEQPALIVIRDFDAFKERLIGYLISLGISKDEIIVEAITYCDFNQNGEWGWFEVNRKPPLELTVKDCSFADQNEARFIIDTRNKAAADYLRSHAIQLGPLTDIAKNVEGYFSEGMEFCCEVELGLLEDKKPDIDALN